MSPDRRSSRTSVTNVMTSTRDPGFPWSLVTGNSPGARNYLKKRHRSVWRIPIMTLRAPSSSTVDGRDVSVAVDVSSEMHKEQVENHRRGRNIFFIGHLRRCKEQYV